MICEQENKPCYNLKSANGVCNNKFKHSKTGILRAYHCDFCNFYHVTSKPPRRDNPTFFKSQKLKHKNDFKKYIK